MKFSYCAKRICFLVTFCSTGVLLIGSDGLRQTLNKNLADMVKLNITTSSMKSNVGSASESIDANLEKVPSINKSIADCYSVIDPVEDSTGQFVYMLNSFNQCVGNSIVIDKPGNYVLCNVITQPITISSDNVTLDLNGYEIIGSSTISSGGQGAIIVDTDRHNIVIKNGTINCNNSGLYGIYIAAPNNCSGIEIDNININKPFYSGLYVKKSTNTKIHDCIITNFNQYGIVSSFSDYLVINNCAINNGPCGICLDNNRYNFINGCMIGSLIATADMNSSGIVSQNGYANTISHCTIENISANGSQQSAYGILLSGIEYNSCITDCLINEVKATSSSKSVGIATEIKASNRVQDIEPQRLAWSPSGKYLAVCGTKNNIPYLYVYEVSQDCPPNLNYVCSVQVQFKDSHGGLFNATGVNDTIWLQGNDFIAVCGSYQSNPDFWGYISVYDFSGTLSLIGSYVPSGNHGPLTVTCMSEIPNSSYFTVAGYDNDGPYPWYGVLKFDAQQLSCTQSIYSSSFGRYYAMASIVVPGCGTFVASGGHMGSDGRPYIRISKFDFDKQSLAALCSDTFQEAPWIGSASKIQAVAWINGGQAVICVCDAGYSKGGYRVEKFALDSEGTCSLKKLTENADYGNNMFGVATLPLLRFAYAIQDDTYSKPIRIGEIVGSTVNPEISALETDQGLVGKDVKWNPKTNMLAVALNNQIFVYAMPTQCLITNNMVTNVTGTGIVDDTGCNIIISNNTYNNLTNYQIYYNPTDHTMKHVSKGTDSTIARLNNISFE